MYHQRDLWADLCESKDLLARQAEPYEDQYNFEENHPAQGPALMYRWRQVPQFPVAKLAWEHTPDEWAQWLDKEVASDAGSGDSNPWTGLLNTKQIDDPITVIIAGDGKYYLWDGNHRVAAAFKNHIKTVPALLGVPKQQPQGKRITYNDLGAAHAQ